MEQVVISKVSLEDIIPHVGVKIKPSHTHTHIKRSNSHSSLSLSQESMIQISQFQSHKTPQEAKMKADLCSILLVIAAVVASQIISWTH